jgi:aspartyl-tRNA synthetase
MTEPEASLPPSKNALKKAAKAAEKARAKAQKSADNELQHRQREAADDPAAENYGDSSHIQSKNSSSSYIKLSDVGKWEDQTCVFRVAVENARIQSSKLAFLALVQGLQSIQLVVAENAESVSRPMVKYAGNIPPESVCTVHAVVKRTTEKVKSTTIQDFELHAKKIYTISKAQVPLPLQPADSEGPLPLEEKTSTGEEDAKTTGPLVSLNTRLNNRVLDLRAKINHCIFLVKDGVDSLFQEFLRSQGFIRIHTPKIISAPSEGMLLSL